MSLILYYRDCFTVDKKLVDLLEGDPDLFSKRSKMFLSGDNRFAGMACGVIPSKQQWYNIYKIVQKHYNDDFTTFLQSGHITKFEFELQEFVKSDYSNSSLIFVYKDWFLEFRYVAKFAGTFLIHTPDTPVAEGTGKYAAAVLINSDLLIDQDNFFKVVSMADRGVSPEYEFIELKNVIETPWYRKYKKCQVI